MTATVTDSRPYAHTFIVSQGKAWEAHFTFPAAAAALIQAAHAANPTEVVAGLIAYDDETLVEMTYEWTSPVLTLRLDRNAVDGLDPVTDLYRWFLLISGKVWKVGSFEVWEFGSGRPSSSPTVSSAVVDVDGAPPLSSSESRPARRRPRRNRRSMMRWPRLLRSSSPPTTWSTAPPTSPTLQWRWWWLMRRRGPGRRLMPCSPPTSMSQPSTRRPMPTRPASSRTPPPLQQAHQQRGRTRH